METTGLDGYILDEQIGFRLRVANQRHLEIFTATLPDLTPTQFTTMVRLKETGVLSQNHLGRLAAMDAATTKGVVDRLRDKGLVVTRPSDTDRRRLDVSLTSEGEALISRLLPLAREISATTTQRLKPREVKQLLTLLEKLQ